MADDLEENFVIEESYLSGAKKRLNQSNDVVDAIFEEDKGHELNPEAVKKKQKRKTITEILELKKDEINRPTYARDELVRILKEHINKKLSVVEKNDLNLNDDTIEEYLKKLVLKRKFTKLALSKQFTKKFDTRFQKHIDANKFKNGQPFAIVLSSSAVRCIEVQKELIPFTGKRVRWMHAFSKHKKLSEQIEYLKQNKVNLIYATPNRLIQLLNENDEKFKKRFFKLLKFLIVDYTHRDCKLKRFIDVNEIRADFLKFFFSFIQPVNSRKAKIKVYLI